MFERELMKLVLALFLFLLSGCVTVRLAAVKQELREGALTSDERTGVETLVRAYVWRKGDAPTAKIEAGAESRFENSFGVTLSGAYRGSVLSGDLDRAIAELDGMLSGEKSDLKKWFLLHEKAKLLIAAGRAADAEEVAESAREFERRALGFELGSVAMRGEARLWLQDYERARQDFYRIVLQIGEWKMPTSYMAPPSNIESLVAMTMAQIRAYVGMAAIDVLTGRFNEARVWGAMAEDRIEDVLAVANHGMYGLFVKIPGDTYYGRAMNFVFLGAALLGTGDASVAEGYFSAANEFFHKTGFVMGETTAMAVRAWVYLKTRQLDLAEKTARAIAAKAEREGIPNLIWKVEALRGQVFLEKGEEKKALNAFLRAHRSASAVSGLLKTDNSKIRFGENKDEIVFHLAKLLKKRKDFQMLFQVLEEARARAFADMLAEVQITGMTADPLGKRLAGVEREYRRLILKYSAYRVEADGLVRAGRDLAREREDLIFRIKKEKPELARFLPATHVRPLSEVQSGLRDGQGILYFIPAVPDENISALLIERSFVRVLEFSFSQNGLRDILFAFTDAIALGNVAGQNRAVKELAAKLKVSAWLSGSGRYIVPTGYSHFIPWGSLTEMAPVSVLPNAAWIEGRSVGSKKKAVVVGDPLFGGKMEQLRGARKESEMLAALYKVEALIGEAATVENIEERMQDEQGILHLATHGKFNIYDPMKSSVVLTDGTAAKELFASEILNRKLSAHTVVLSACATGMGRTVAGDDFLGLARSFYLSGTRALVSSLWSVDDEGTGFFMREFHRQYAGRSVGQAWLAAVRATKRHGYPPAVYGAFTLGGEL